MCMGGKPALTMADETPEWILRRFTASSVRLYKKGRCFASPILSSL